MSETHTETGTAATGSAPAGGGKAATIGGIVGVLIIVGFGVAVGIVGFPGKAHEKKPEHQDPMVDPEAAKPTALLAVPQIVVNLSDQTGKHLLQSTWTIEISATDVAAAGAKFGEWLPRVQDQMIKVLSSYRSIELEGGQNKDFVQTRIKDILNGTVFQSEEAKVRGVYFTEFVIQ